MTSFPAFPRSIATVGLVVSVLGPAADAAPEHDDWLRENYRKSEHMVPMRDGVELYTQVYAPTHRAGPHPVMLFRTPYSIRPYGLDQFRSPLGPSVEFDRRGYIFVFQDVRGKFRSEGDFEIMRVPAAEPKGPTDVDESTDNYDTIEWILKSVSGHNGRIGQWGISYPGWQTVTGMLDAHPALVASSPQASPSDMFIGDDWHHNGAFRIMYAFSWLAGNARRRDQPTEARVGPFDYGTPWGYGFFLDAGAASNIDERYFHGDVPAWNDFMAHPDYDEYWQRQNFLQYLDDIRPAVLNVAGWFDTEDFYGPMSIYRTVEARNPETENVLVVGPWLHGGWNEGEGDHLGCVEFDRKTSLDFQRDVQLPFFEHHLRGEGEWDAPEAVVFETGTNEWRTFERWPPEAVEAVKLFLRGEGQLSFDPPAEPGDGASDRYLSDPSHPVPFSTEVRTTLGHLWKVEDQRFASARPDVLVYESEVLSEDLTIAGPILANLFVSTTGTDSDWIVKLIDVYPPDAKNSAFCEVPMGGFQMHLAGEIMRGRYRDSFENPEAMVPGEATPIRIDLRDRFHTFKAGHKIMVHVQSSWFPAYDRNPQSYVDIYHAKPEDYVTATQTVYRSTERPSHLVLGVLPSSSRARARGLSEEERSILEEVRSRGKEAEAFLERTVNINSGTLNPEGVRRVGELFEAELRDLGFATRWTEPPPGSGRAGHLFAEREGMRGKSLLLIGHLDTVFEPSSPFQSYSVKDGIASGPGVSDMKGGDVVLLFALKALAAAGLLEDTTITVAYIGDEEKPGKPLSEVRRELIEAARRSDVALGFEGGVARNRATIARRSSFDWMLGVTGKSGHSSQIFKPEFGSGAIFEAARILSAFHDELAGDEYLTFNPSVIVGGTDVEFDPEAAQGRAFGKTNVIAQKVTVNGGIRALTEEQLQEAHDGMRSIVARHLPGTSAEIVFREGYPPMAPTDGNRKLLALFDAVSRDIGHGAIEPLDPGARGAADISFAAPHADALAGIGPVGRGSHSVEDALYLDTLPVATERAAVFIYRLTR